MNVNFKVLSQRRLSNIPVAITWITRQKISYKISSNSTKENYKNTKKACPPPKSYKATEHPTDLPTPSGIDLTQFITKTTTPIKANPSEPAPTLSPLKISATSPGMTLLLLPNKICKSSSHKSESKGNKNKWENDNKTPNPKLTIKEIQATTNIPANSKLIKWKNIADSSPPLQTTPNANPTVSPNKTITNSSKV